MPASSGFWAPAAWTRASMSSAPRSIRVHPSGSVTAKRCSGITTRPVVATLAAGLAAALADALGDASTDGAVDSVWTGWLEGDAAVDAVGVPPHAAATSDSAAMPVTTVARV